MEAAAVVAKEFGLDDVGRCVPGLVKGGEVQLPKQFSFVSAEDHTSVAVFAAALQYKSRLSMKREHAPERII